MSEVRFQAKVAQISIVNLVLILIFYPLLVIYKDAFMMGLLITLFTKKQSRGFFFMRFI